MAKRGSSAQSSGPPPSNRTNKTNPLNVSAPPTTTTGLASGSINMMKPTSASRLSPQVKQQHERHHQTMPLGTSAKGAAARSASASGHAASALTTATRGGSGGGGFDPSLFAPRAKTPTAKPMPTLLTLADVERLRAANSRYKQRGLLQTDLSRGDEAGDREILNLHTAVFKRLEASRMLGLDEADAPTTPQRGGDASKNNNSINNYQQHDRSAEETEKSPALSSSSTVAYLSKVKGVPEALEVARLVAAESRAERGEGFTAKLFSKAPSRSTSNLATASTALRKHQKPMMAVDKEEGEKEAPRRHQTSEDSLDEDQQQNGTAKGAHSSELDVSEAALDASAIHAMSTVPEVHLSLSAASPLPPSARRTAHTRHSSNNSDNTSYFERVIAKAPPTERLRDVMAAEISHHSDKYKSGSALVDGCREELDRFLTLEAASVSKTTPIAPEVRLATLFPHQSLQWQEVIERTAKNGGGALSRRLEGVEFKEDRQDEHISNAKEDRAPSSSFTPSAVRSIQRKEEEAISNGAVERYTARQGVDKAFKNISSHRLIHLKQDVFKLSEEELAGLGDTAGLLQSKGEVQRLLQGASSSTRQTTIDEMKAWTDSVVQRNRITKAFEEQLDSLRPGPDGCITSAQFKQCLQAAAIVPSQKAMSRFVSRVDPLGSGRLRVSAIREAWAEGELRLGLEPIEVYEARSNLEFVIPSARQALGLSLTPAHIIQWLSRMGAAVDTEDAEAFVASHHPLTSEKTFRPDVYSDLQSLWLRAKTRANDAVSEVGLHQRLRELETGQTVWDMALDDLERHTNAMQSGFGALNSLQSEMDRQAKKVRLLAQLVPTKYARTVAVNTDVSYPLDALAGATLSDVDSGAESDAEERGDPAHSQRNGGGGRMPKWRRRRTSTASSTTAPGADSPRNLSVGAVGGISPIARGGGAAGGGGGGDNLSLSVSRRSGLPDMSGGGANAIAARDRLVEDLHQQIKHKNEELVRVRVQYEGYKFKAESTMRNTALMLQVKDAELSQMTERLQSYEAIDSGVLGEGSNAEERLQEIQSHFLKKMRESEAAHQEEIRSFAFEIQTARNNFETQRHALITELNEQKDLNQKRLERILHIEAEIKNREEALSVNTNATNNLTMNLKLLQMEMDGIRNEAQNSRDRAKMLEEQLSAARKTQQLYIPREEMERRVREKEAEFKLKMDSEAESRDKLQEALKLAKDRLQAASMSEIEIKASAEKRLNAFRIDLEKISTHRLQLLVLLKDTLGQWFSSVRGIREGLSTGVELASDLFPWVSLQCSMLLQTLTESAQSASKHLMEIAQGADVHNELLELLREARKESTRQFTPPRDNIAQERDLLEKQLASAVKESKESAATAREVTEMLAVTKCAVQNLEDTLSAVTEAINAAANGDDRAISKYNLSGPGAQHVAQEKMAEALKAFVPRRMPVSIANALEFVGGENGLKNKQIAIASDDGGGSGGDGKTKEKDKGMNFASRMAQRKANSADPSTKKKKEGDKDKKGGKSPLEEGVGGPSATAVDSKAGAVEPIYVYDSPLALQSLSQSLHSVQADVFNALGGLSGRFAVLNSAVEQSMAQASAAISATAEARQALQKQSAGDKSLRSRLGDDDEDNDEDSGLGAASEAKTRAGMPTSKSGSSRRRRSLMTDGEELSEAAPLLTELVWSVRSAADTIAANTVRPSLLRAEQLCTTIKDTASLAKIEEARQRIERARALYVQRLLKHLVAVRGATRLYKMWSKAYTDAMYDEAAKSDNSNKNGSGNSYDDNPATRQSTASSGLGTNRFSHQQRRRSDAMSSTATTKSDSRDELRRKFLAAKTNLNTILFDGARDLAPLVAKFQQALWGALAVADRVVSKARSAIGAATAAAGEEASAAASKRHHQTTHSASRGNNKQRPAGAMGGAKVVGSSGSPNAAHSQQGAKPVLSHLGHAGGASKSSQLRTGSASSVPRPNKKAIADGSKQVAATHGPEASKEDNQNSAAIRHTNSDLSENAAEELRREIHVVDAGIADEKRAADSATVDGYAHRLQSFDEAYRAFDFDDGHNTFISDGSEGSSSSSSSSRASSNVFPVAFHDDEEEGDAEDWLGVTGTLSIGMARQDGPSGKHVREVGTQATPASGGGEGAREKGRGARNRNSKSSNQARERSKGAGDSHNLSASSHPKANPSQLLSRDGGKSSPNSLSRGKMAKSTGGEGAGQKAAWGQRSTQSKGGKGVSGRSTGKMSSVSAASSSAPAVKGEGGNISGSPSRATTPRLKPTLSVGKGATGGRLLNDPSEPKRASPAGKRGSNASTRSQASHASSQQLRPAASLSSSNARLANTNGSDANAAATEGTLSLEGSKQLLAKLEAYEATIRELTAEKVVLVERLGGQAEVHLPAGAGGENGRKEERLVAEVVPAMSDAASIPLQHRSDMDTAAAGSHGPRGLGQNTNRVLSGVPSTKESVTSKAAPPPQQSDFIEGSADFFANTQKTDITNTDKPLSNAMSPHRHQSGLSRTTSPTSSAAKVELARQRREEMEKAARDRKEAAISEKALRPLNGGVRPLGGPTPRDLRSDPDLEGSRPNQRPADTDIADEGLAERETRVSSATRSRPLPRPMSGLTRGPQQQQLKPMHRTDSEPDLAVVRPSSASVRADAGAGDGNDRQAMLFSSTVPQQLQYVPHYLRPCMDSVATQTDPRDLVLFGTERHQDNVVSTSENRFVLPIEQRIKTWGDIRKDYEAQEKEALRRMGRVLYSHVSGIGVGPSSSSASPGVVAAGSGYTSSLRAVPSTALRPSIHLEAPVGKAFCGLKYKEILIEDESFEANAPSKAAALDVIFSSLPPECRIVAAKYSLLAMFGGEECPLATDYTAFEEHLAKYHFYPHSHIKGPRHDTDREVLRAIHADLVGIGAALLTGDFMRYTATRRGKSPSALAKKRAPSPILSVAQARPAEGEGDEDGNNPRSAGEATINISVMSAVSHAATNDGGAPEVGGRDTPSWVNLERFAGGNSIAHTVVVVHESEGDHRGGGAKKSSSSYHRSGGADQMVSVARGSLQPLQRPSSSSSTAPPANALSPLPLGVVAEGKRFFVSSAASNPSTRANTSLETGTMRANASDVTRAQPFRVRPLPTPATFPDSLLSSSDMPSNALRLEVIPTKTKKGGQLEDALHAVAVGAGEKLGGASNVTACVTPFPTNAQPRSAVAAILASIPRATTPSIPSSSSHTLVTDPSSPFVDKALLSELYSDTSSAFKRSHDHHRGGAANSQPSSAASHDVSSSANESKSKTVGLRAVASGKPNRGTIAMERALRVSIAENREALAASGANASPLTVARVLREGGKGESVLANVSSSLAPVVASGGTRPPTSPSTSTSGNRFASK